MTLYKESLLYENYLKSGPDENNETLDFLLNDL